MSEREALALRIQTLLTEEQSAHLERYTRLTSYKRSAFRRQPGRYEYSPYLAGLIQAWECMGDEAACLAESRRRSAMDNMSI